MNNKSPNDDEYTITGFSELVASPFFYSVIVLTVILGFASAFGFFQNPRKLKLIIDLISQRVFISEVERKHGPKLVSNRAYSVAEEKLQIIYKRDGNVTASSLNQDRYSIFAEELVQKDRNFQAMDTTVSVAIDYDISSNQFWGDLNVSHSAGISLGSPISPYYSIEKDLSRYSLKVNHGVL